MTGLSLLSPSGTSSPLHDDACIHGYPLFASGGLFRVRTEQTHEGTDGQAAIYRLPPFERAVRCTKYFEAGIRKNITRM